MAPRVLLGGLTPLVHDLVAAALDGAAVVEELEEPASDSTPPAADDDPDDRTIVITGVAPGQQTARLRQLLRVHPTATVVLLSDDAAEADLHELWPRLIESIANPGPESLRGVVARATAFDQREPAP